MDNRYDDSIKKAYISSFAGVSKEIYYLNIIGTKILLPDRKKRFVGVDENRLFDEFVYFRHYSSMDEKCLLGFFIPLILANRSYKNCEHCVISLADKLTKFYGINRRKYVFIIEAFVMSRASKIIMKDRKTDLSSVFSHIRDELVEYTPVFEDKTDNVRFQIDKIEYIKEVHSIADALERGEDVSADKDIFEIITDAYNDVRPKDFGKMSVFSFFRSLFTGEAIVEDCGNSGDNVDSFINYGFINSMSDYLVRLRNFSVEKSCYGEKSSPKRFLAMEPGQSVMDPVLNRAKLVEKYRDGNYAVAVLSTKTGEYRLRYRLKE